MAVVLVGFVHGLVPADLVGEWQSRRCEVSAPEGVLPTYLERQFSFSEDEWSLRVDVFLHRACGASLGYIERITGTYDILNQASTPEYGVVHNADFHIVTRTHEIRNTDLLAAFNNADCGVQFELNTEVDTWDIDCAAVGIESVKRCSDGERDIISIYADGSLHLGDRFQGDMCELPRPTLLEPFGVVRPGSAAETSQTLPTAVLHFTERGVIEALNALSGENVVRMITEISSTLHNRYYSTADGQLMGDYVYEAFAELAACSRNAEVTRFDNAALEAGFLQASTIATIPGSGDYPEYAIVIAAHIDSCAFIDPDTGVSDFTSEGENPAWATRRAPGADDNLTGLAVLLEVYRVLLEQGFVPDRTIHFIAVAGEEKGIVDGVVTGKAGSELVARHFRQTGVEVLAMLNLDSVGNNYVPTPSLEACNVFGARENGIAVFGYDTPGFEGSAYNVDPVVRDAVFGVFESYVQSPYFPQEGPNGASDHLSFINNLFPSTGVVESNIAVSLSVGCTDPPFHHTDRDVVDNVDVEYLLQSARGVLGFVAEMSKDPNPREESLVFEESNVVCSLDTILSLCELQRTCSVAILRATLFSAILPVTLFLL